MHRDHGAIILDNGQNSLSTLKISTIIAIEIWSSSHVLVWIGVMSAQKDSCKNTSKRSGTSLPPRDVVKIALLW
jgi:hypothetical protein